MSSTFTLYKPVSPSAAITHVVSCNLLGPQSQDLVVVRHNYIEVYALAAGAAGLVAAQAQLAHSSPSSSGLTDQPLLHRKMDKQLYGNVEGLCVVRLPGWTRDALLLAYPHSKLSLCVWDVGTLEMATLAIWTQDEEVVGAAAMAAAKAAASEAQAQAAQAALKGSTLMHLAKNYMAPILRVDPSSRCAALVTFDNFLNIFDLSHAAAAQAHAHAHAAQSAAPDAKNGQACQSGVTTSTTGTHSFYATAASALSSTVGAGLLPSLAQPSTYTLGSLQLGTITDMQFLHGFEDPTLLILHEKRRTWAGRAAVTALGSQELTAVTFHPRAQAFSVIGRVSGVSHDTLAIYPIPMPLGGALLFAQNTVWHWNNNALDYALSLNALGGELGASLGGAGKMAHVEQSAHVLTLDQSHATFLHTYTDVATMFIATKNGESYLLHVTPSGQGVKRMALEAIGMLPVPQGVVKIVPPAHNSATAMLLQSMASSSAHAMAAQAAPAFLFAFSRLGPSLLLEYRRPDEAERRRAEEEAREEENAIVAERQKEMAAATARKEAVAAAAAQAAQAAQQAAAQAASPSDTVAAGGMTAIPSLSAELDAAASAPSDGPQSGTKSSLVALDALEDADEAAAPAAKRSRIDDMYRQAFEFEGDELMDVFGFASASSGTSSGQAAMVAGVPATTTADSGLTKAADPFALAAVVPAPNSGLTTELSADGTPLDAAEIEAKEAEATNQRVAADKEVARRAALAAAFRARHDLCFFVRDRLACSSSAPMHDLALGHLLPPEEDAALEAEERDQALADEAAKRLERDVAKPASDEEERAQQALELAELAELEKRWRDKERHSRVIEMVHLSGFESSGAVVLSHEGVVPDVVAKLELEHQCVGCWTLRNNPAPKSKIAAAAADDDAGHAFLLIATPTSTLVFRTGEQISQMVEPSLALDQAYTEFLQARGVDVEWAAVKDTDEARESTGSYSILTAPVRAELSRAAKEASQHPFSTARTVAASNVSAKREGGDSASTHVVEGIVQVMSNSLRLVHNDALLEERPLQGDNGAGAALEYVSAQFESPFIVLRLSDQSLRVVTLRATSTGMLSLGDAVVPALQPALDAFPISSFALFKDETSTRALKSLRAGADAKASGAVGMDIDGTGGVTALPAAAAVLAPPQQPIEEMDELELMLGGGALAAAAAPVAAAAAPAPAGSTAVVPPDHYLVVARNACVEIYSLPALELVYSIPRLSMGRRILQHADASAGPESNGTTAVSTFASSSKLDALELHLSDSDLPPVMDLFLGVVSDAHDALPVLMAFLDNGDLLAYQSFVAVEAAGTPALRWLREQTPLLSRPFLSATDNPLLGSVMAPAQSLLGSGSGGSKEPAQAVEKTYRDVFGVARSPSERARAQPSRFQRLSHLGAADSSRQGRRTGVLIAGTKPLFVFAERSALRMHPMVVDWRARGDAAAFEDEEDVESDASSASGAAAQADGGAGGARKKEGLVCSAPFHYSFRDEDGTRVRSFGLVYFDTRGTLHIAKLHPAAPLPSHPLYMSERKMQSTGLASPLLATLDCHSTLSPSIAPSPAVVDYDSSPLLRRAVHLGATPRFIARHTPTSTTAVVVSRRVRIPSRELESERTVPVYADRFEVLLFHSRSWELIGRYAEFEPNEMVLTATTVTLHKQVYIALGTSVYQGEDVATRGRIVLIDLFFSFGNARADAAASTEGNSGADATEQVKLLKIKVYSQAEKLPVSILAPMAPNLLIAGEGSKIILYAHNGRQLVGRAFFDCQIWITSLSSLNSFILYGDELHGLHLLYYDSVLRTLTQLGMSHERFHVTACEFLVDMRQLNLVAGDEDGNMHMFKFQPNTPAHAGLIGARVGGSGSGALLPTPENAALTLRPLTSQGHASNPYTCTSALGGLGYKLSLRNDFHLGERAGHMKRLRLRSRPAAGGLGGGAAHSGVTPSGAATPAPRPIQSALLMGSYAGGLAQLLPSDQLSFRRLATLSMHLSQSLAQVGGLHPLGYRLFRSTGPHHPQLAKKVLDLSLLMQYATIDIATQWRLARLIGTTPAQIIDSLKRVAWATQMH